MTDVVAALIWDGDRFLACQRPAHKKRGLLWEFVGGKVESGETHQEALIRECREELAVTVAPQHVFMEVIHEYPDITVRLILFNAVITQGAPQMLEHNDIRWITPSQISDYSFCPADKDILAVLSTVHSHIQAELYAQRDLSYKAFQMPLIPGMEHDRFLGVRMPILRKMAKSIPSVQALGPLSHRYHEENCLHGILINMQKDFEQTVALLDDFLPHVDNWAVCDLLSPAAFKSCPQGLLRHVKRWLSSSHPYTVRFAIGVLMKFYLEDTFQEEFPDWVASIRFEHYYVKMMVAWYFATALAKQFQCAYNYLKENRLDPWTHNKTVQKACESFRLTQAQKERLRALKIRSRKD